MLPVIAHVILAVSIALATVEVPDLATLTADTPSQVEQYLALRQVDGLEGRAPRVHKNACGLLVVSALSGLEPERLLVDYVAQDDRFNAFVKGAGLTLLQMEHLLADAGLDVSVLDYRRSLDAIPFGKVALVALVSINDVGALDPSGHTPHWVAVLGVSDALIYVYNPYHNREEEYGLDVFMGAWTNESLEASRIGLVVTLDNK